MRRFGPALLALLLLAGPARAAGRDLADARIAGLEGRVRGDELLVSFRLENAFPEELVERLHSGIAVKFRHKVDMVLRRPFFLVPRQIQLTATGRKRLLHTNSFYRNFTII